MKMKFNRENYEAYVLDYLEGKLTDSDHDLFLEFLKDNPDIYEEIKDTGNIQLKSASIQFHDKNILKKSIILSEFDSDFENLCIAFIEGDLESTERPKFESWLSENSDKLYEFELFRKSYLKPDMNIIFSPKSRLKRFSINQKRIRLVSVISAAAVVVFLILFIRYTDVLKRDMISEKTDTGTKTITDTKISKDESEQKSTDTQFANNQLIESESVKGKSKELQEDSNRDFGLNDNNWADNNNAGREKIIIKPVSSMLAKLENYKSVDYNRLKKTGSEPTRNFESYQTLREFASNQILTNLFPGDGLDKQTKITFWDLASNGFEELSRITDGGYTLNRETNENGKLKRLSLETPLLGFSIPIKNKQPQ